MCKSGVCLKRDALINIIGGNLKEERVISVLSALAGAVNKVSENKVQAIYSHSEKHLALFIMMNQWVRVKQAGKSLASFFEKNANAIYADVNIVSMEDNLEEVDAIVVTAITFFDEIEEKLSERVDCPIISLEDILYDI